MLIFTSKSSWKSLSVDTLLYTSMEGLLKENVLERIQSLPRILTRFNVRKFYIFFTVFIAFVGSGALNGFSGCSVPVLPNYFLHHICG